MYKAINHIGKTLFKSISLGEVVNYAEKSVKASKDWYFILDPSGNAIIKY